VSTLWGFILNSGVVAPSDALCGIYLELRSKVAPSDALSWIMLDSGVVAPSDALCGDLS